MTAFDTAFSRFAAPALDAEFGLVVSYRRYVGGSLADGFPVALTGRFIEGESVTAQDGSGIRTARTGMLWLAGLGSDPIPGSDEVDLTRDTEPERWLLDDIVEQSGGAWCVLVRLPERVVASARRTR